MDPREKGRTPEKLRGPQSPTGGRKGKAIRDADDVVHELSDQKETELTIVIGLECNKTGSSRGKKSYRSDDQHSEPIGNQKQRVVGTSLDGIKETKQLGDGESSQKRKLGRPRKKQISTSASTAIEPSADIPNDKIKVAEFVTNEVGSTANVRLDVTAMEPSTPIEVPLIVSDDAEEQLKDQVAQKRKRGSTRKMSLTKMSNNKSFHSSEQHEKPSLDVPAMEHSTPIELSIIVSDDAKEQLKDQIGQKRKRGSARKISLTKMSNDKSVHSLEQHENPSLRKGRGRRKQAKNVNIESQTQVHSPEQHEKPSLRKSGRRRQAKIVNIESQTQGSLNASVTAETNSIAGVEEKVIAEVPTNGFDAQPLSKWFEERQAPTSMEGSRGALVIADGSSTIQSDLQSLPFIKNTFLWKTIESMDVFQRIPQKPHFRPLEHCKESSREGLAIGYMVTFSSVVEKTSRLNYKDSGSTIKELLETLCDLESHGFNVQVVRDHLTGLLLLKDKHEKLEAQIADIGGQINKHKMDRNKVDGEIEEINKQIAELQGKLYLSVSRKEAKDREIDALRSTLEDIRAGIKNVPEEFEAFSGKPF